LGLAMPRDAESCRTQAEYCRYAALHSPPELAEEFRRIAEAWMKLAEGLDPEVPDEQHQAAQRSHRYGAARPSDHTPLITKKSNSRRV
jgi:hypothetical protein